MLQPISVSMLSRKQIFILRFSLYFIYHTIIEKIDGNALAKKIIVNIFNYKVLLIKQLSIPTYSTKLTLYTPKWVKDFVTTQNASTRFLEILYVNYWS